MDPFDEFEFKPLTEGLGFNKKPETQVKNSSLIDEHFESLPSSIPRTSDDVVPRKAMTFDDVIKSLEKAPLKVTETLPRKAAPQVENPRPVQSPFPSQDIFRKPTPDFKKMPSINESAPKAGVRRGAANSPQGRLIPTQTSIPAAALDLIFVTALTLIFLAALLTVTHTDLNLVIHGVRTETWTRASLGVLFLAIMQMYVVISRSFYGCTVGEWTFDIQLGKNDEQLNALYPLKVIVRSFLVTVTGLVLLPMASLLMGEDVAGLISGTQLFERK